MKKITNKKFPIVTETLRTLTLAEQEGVWGASMCGYTIPSSCSNIVTCPLTHVVVTGTQGA